MAARRRPGQTLDSVTRQRAREVFLAELADGHTVKYAAEKAGVSRQAAYSWREMDEDFRLAWASAEEEGIQALEEAARKLAVEGTEVQIFDRNGNLLRTEFKQSERLLEFLLKAKRPKTYRERVSVTGEDGGPLEVKHVEGASAALAARLALVAERGETVSSTG
jgi:flagellar biosynthesis/type III secretory pathway chaperone